MEIWVKFRDENSTEGQSMKKYLEDVFGKMIEEAAKETGKDAALRY